MKKSNSNTNKSNLVNNRIKKKKKKSNTLSKFKKSKLGRILFMFSNDKNNYSFSEVFIITIASLFLGAFSCFCFFTIIFGGFSYLSSSKELSKFYEVYDLLVNNYYGDVDKSELIDSAIDGMAKSLGDSYTTYSDSIVANDFSSMVSGIYAGIGCTIAQSDSKIKVIEVYDGGPASRAGIMSGDIIIKVDDLDGDLLVSSVSDYIRNKANDKIELLVLRDDVELSFEVVRDNVEIPVVSGKLYEINNKKIAYIKLSLFSSVSFKQFKKELLKYEADGIDGLVLDVRNNNGGYLSSVTDIASCFLPKGSAIYQISKDDKSKVTKDKTAEKREYPVAIVVNSASASAAEVLASAIEESYGGFVVGVKTYGKGTVQQFKKLSDGSMIKYTIENWLTPLGNWIDGVGIEPTNEVVYEKNYESKSIYGVDNQLETALILVSK